jgi:predicted outer membrane repeat protein
VKALTKFVELAALGCMRAPAILALCLACSSAGGSGAGGSGAGGSSAGGSSAGGSGAGGSNTGGSNTGGSSTGGAGPTPEPPTAACASPIELVDVSAPDHVVGSGTSESCTEEALTQAVNAGGIITFDCGGPATIEITSALELRTDVDTTIDGGGSIILDGGRPTRQTRIFEFRSPNYRATDTTVTLQRLTLQNAEAPANDYTPPDPANPQCAYGYGDGQGGAIFVRDGILHVIDTVIQHCKAATPGPDTGGGAIYALGSREVVVVGSTLFDNEGSNSGAVGLLQSDGIFVNTTIANNRATGVGQNSCCDSACPGIGHPDQTGGGGNAGAVGVDGDSVDRVSFCGVTFRDNWASELGTFARTPNVTAPRTTTFDRCHFEGNFAGDGGGAIWTRDMHLVITNSTFANNSATGLGGGVRAEASTLEIENSTFFGNSADHGLGGALVFRGEARVRNCTFAENRAIGGYVEDVGAFFGAAVSGGHDGDRRFVVENTIFANNTDTHPYTPMTCNVPEPLDGANNLQWPIKRVGEDGTPSDVDDNPCVSGIAFANPELGALADHGGVTPTMMPSGTSPALGAGQNCPPYDQRGQPRPSSGCALGAVEP